MGFGAATIVVACVKGLIYEKRNLFIIATKNPGQAYYKVIQKTVIIEMAEKKASEKSGSNFTIF